MTDLTIQQRILTDDTYLQHELDTIASYYQLKHTMRWAHTRTEIQTESVAEHVFGLHLLIDYFTPLHSDLTIDMVKVRQLATWHDMAEALVGDMPTRSKTQAHRDKEAAAEHHLVATAPTHIRPLLDRLYTEYNARQTIEARFLKAIDKIEPQFHLYALAQQATDLAPYFHLGWTPEEYRAHRHPYLKDFPIIKRFDDLLYEHIKTAGFHDY